MRVHAVQRPAPERASGRAYAAAVASALWHLDVIGQREAGEGRAVMAEGLPDKAPLVADAAGVEVSEGSAQS